MEKKVIKFGTDGWRGILAEDFTFDNVRLVARAAGRYVLAHGMAEKGLVVAYDTRFLSERFAGETAELLASMGIPVYLTRRPTPTPVAAYAILLYRAAGAVVFTASHNPPEYNGFKFIPHYAGPALPHITAEIEDNIRAILAGGDKTPAGGTGAAEITGIDPYPDYARHLSTLVDLAAIGRAGLKVVVDPMYGAGAGYLEDILAGAGAEVESIHSYRDPLFGGTLPEPAAKSLAELSSRVAQSGADLGLALDGDADRFGIVDRGGSYVSPNRFLPVLLHHLLAARGMRGPVARTVATTHLLDTLAAACGLEVFETPVGFKYIGQCLLERGAVLGGEESGGLSVRGHVPEKDGILAGLLAAEMVAVHRKSILGLLGEIHERFGRAVSERVDVHTSLEEKERVLALLKTLRPDELAGKKVARAVTVDGLKLVLEGGAWVLVRPSGTEPLFRVYTEAPSEEEMAAVQKDFLEKTGLSV